MKTYQYASILFCSICLLLISHGIEVTGAETRKPNILFMISDDMPCSLGCYGHPIVKSPNIDQLAARGIRFDQAYCNFALCNPCRTSFLSGKYPEVTKVYGNSIQPRSTLGNVTMMEEYLHSQGYFTARCGKIAHESFANEFKWDIDLASAPGVKVEKETGMLQFGTPHLGQMWDEDDLEENRMHLPMIAQDQFNLRKFDLPRMLFLLGARAEAKKDNSFVWKWEALKDSDEETPDGSMARYIAKLLAERKDQAQPFFIAAGFHKPHTPWKVPKKYFDMYPPKDMKLPRDLGEPANDRDDIPPIAFTPSTDFQVLSDDKRREATAAEYACISHVDAGVGIIMEAMDHLKLWDNTLVIFVSDHGYHMGEHGGLARKITLFQEATHVPLIAVVPGGPTGAVCTRSVELLDFYPTFADYCGTPKPPGVQGVSFVSLLKDPNAPEIRPIYSVVQRGAELGRSVHTLQYRYTDWSLDRGTELYDLQKDPKEYTNLANKPEAAAIKSEMKRLLEEAERRPGAVASAQKKDVPAEEAE
jgi:iduronate 2-sulfatase